MTATPLPLSATTLTSAIPRGADDAQALRGHSMHYLDLPAGSAVRLQASARPGVALHRWDLRVIDAGAAGPGALARLTYGSAIGAGDSEQRVDIPAQDTACRLEVWGRHAVAGAWKDDRCSIEVDTPDCLQIGFSDRALALAQTDDVLLSFTFDRGGRRS